jgi:hypothetical protein
VSSHGQVLKNYYRFPACYDSGVDPADPWEDFLKKKKFPKSAGQAFSLFMAVFPDNDAGESKSCLICYFL